MSVGRNLPATPIATETHPQSSGHAFFVMLSTVARAARTVLIKSCRAMSVGPRKQVTLFYDVVSPYTWIAFEVKKT